MADFCDVNVPLALNDPEHPFHRPALKWLATAQPGGVVMCRAVQVSLLRLLTNPHVLGDAVCTNTEAWSVCERTLADERFVLQWDEPAGVGAAFLAYSNRRTRSPKLWQDAYLAAWARCGGHRLVTTDGDFRQFEGLECLVLKAASQRGGK